MPVVAAPQVVAERRDVAGGKREDQDNKDTARRQVEEEEAEVPVVVEADAVVDPGAVVVHLEHAPLADAAVVRPGWLQPPALPALLRPARLRRLGGRTLPCVAVVASRAAPVTWQLFWPLRCPAWVRADGHGVVVQHVGQQEDPRASEGASPRRGHALPPQGGQDLVEEDRGLPGDERRRQRDEDDAAEPRHHRGDDGIAGLVVAEPAEEAGPHGGQALPALCGAGASGSTSQLTPAPCEAATRGALTAVRAVIDRR
mmetsp:Transcript_5764/g.16392  ORF Transcript_5764/g.16392 Transcript_5764/m.16392 type:complete len:257 (-) Transcript_5764:164-934(-)